LHPQLPRIPLDASQDASEMARSRGKKSKLPPRVRLKRWIPRLSRLDFASREIIEALTAARGNFPDDVFIELDINNEIRDIVGDYMGDRCSRIPPKEFRQQIRAFKKALDAFFTKFPDLDGAVAEALNRELDQVDVEQAPDLAIIRDILDVLLGAVVSVDKRESGAGTDANREAHLLVEGLASIYKKHTGKRPSKKIDGPFGRFVKAVNEHIPERFKLNGLVHLLRGMG
jgi:hypothetical protein